MPASHLIEEGAAFPQAQRFGADAGGFCDDLPMAIYSWWGAALLGRPLTERFPLPGCHDGDIGMAPSPARNALKHGQFELQVWHPVIVVPWVIATGKP